MITSIFTNQLFEKENYLFHKSIDTLAYSTQYGSCEGFGASGGIIDRIVHFLEALIKLIRKILVNIITWIGDRFRRDRSLYSKIESMSKSIQKKYNKLSSEQKNTINEVIANKKSAAVWNNKDMNYMVSNFDSACKYVSTDLISHIKQDIDNIFEDPEWYMDITKLKSIGITLDANSGSIGIQQVISDESGTLQELGYTDVDTVLKTTRTYMDMFSNYEKSQHLVNTIKDLESALSTQVKAVKKDIMIAEGIKNNTTSISAAIKRGITLVKELVPVLMNMFTFMSRRIGIILGTVYYSLNK